MAEVTPFRGIRYNPEGISNFSDVTAPPYDIISPQEKDNLYSRNPFNIVQIDFGKDQEGDDESKNRYTRAGAHLEQWLSSHVLIRDDKPVFYGYEVEYEMKGQNLRFRGLMCRVRIEPFSAGIILPHEETHSKPKADRLNLLRATEANISPIFSLYSSVDQVTSRILFDSTQSQEPVVVATDTLGCTHRLWVIDDPAAIAAISSEIKPLPVFIADGHHRYETSLEYMMERKGAPADRVLMFLANMEEPGLTALPTHRMIRVRRDELVAGLSRAGRLTPMAMKPGQEDFLDSLSGRGAHCFGVYAASGKGYRLEVEPGRYRGMAGPLGRLDVTVLHRYVFEETLGVSEFAYEMDPSKAMAKVDEGDFGAAFFLNPTRLQELRDVALDGKRMPPKSTYFFPKLLTGMVINRLD